MNTKRQILEQIMDKVIAKYGFEAKESINFCRLVEKENKVFSKVINAEYKRLMN